MKNLLKKGEDLFSIGEMAEARGCFETIIATDSQHKEALNNLGVISFTQGDLEMASYYFERALGVDENYVEAIENLNDCLLKRGEYLKAMNLLEQAFNRGIGSATLHNALSQCFIQLDDLSTSERILGESLNTGSKEAEDSRSPEKECKCEISAHTPQINQHGRRNIGFISVWFERGQAYVTKTIRDALDKSHNTFIFARTGRVYGDKKIETKGYWDVPNLTVHSDYKIPHHLIENWIVENRLDAVIFNEEYDWDLVKFCKKQGIKIFSYLDYYENAWESSLCIYDAVLCSTKRSYDLVKSICRAEYIGWCIDTDLFSPSQNGDGKFTFFHNAGWLGINFRKMTPATIVAFDIVSKRFPEVTLLVHAQAGVDQLPKQVVKIIGDNPRITYHVETLRAPGLYHKGHILVFPSKLEGLGLPLLEGLSSGLPAIATDAPPMNEFVSNGDNGLLVPASVTFARDDHIAFLEHIVETKDLAFKMATLANNPAQIKTMSIKARQFALEELSPQAFAERISATVSSHL